MVAARMAPMPEYAAPAVRRVPSLEVEVQSRSNMARTLWRPGTPRCCGRTSPAFESTPFVHEIATKNARAPTPCRTEQEELGGLGGIGAANREDVLFERGGAMHEGRASYIGSIGALDRTRGGARSPADLESAMAAA